MGLKLKGNKKENDFGIRLKQLRKERKLTQKELGEKVGVKQNTFTNWENGKRVPSYENLVKLADIFGVSVDWFLGRCFRMGCEESNLFSYRLKELRRVRNFSQVELSKMLGISQKAFSHWETQKTDPTIEHVERLADIFGVSIDYLLGRLI